MKILVTGGAGFIGSHVVDAFLEAGHNVVIVDNLSTGKKENINPKAVFHKVDILNFNDLDQVFEKEKPDLVDHHAAQVDVRKSMQNPILDAEINMIGSLNLIELSKKHKVKGFIYISTGGAIYGEPKYLPVDENHQIEPLSQYGVNKHTVEHFLFINKQQGLNYIVLRYPNIYGPRQDPSGEAGVVAIFSTQMLKGSKSVIFGDGSKTRDYVYVKDVANANVLACDHINSCEAFNLGWGKEITDFEIYDQIRTALNVTAEPVYDKKRLGEVDRICLTSLKAQKTLGWQPNVELKEGIKLATEYYKTRFCV